MVEITKRVKGILVLASGRVFEGWIFGAVPKPSDVKKEIEASGEVVFNTSLTGYQEILTGPSYYGQIVVMTPSHIGNYGVNDEDVESRRIFLSGFITQEVSFTFSNWRAIEGLDSYLKRNGVTGLAGVDTRALTRHLRTSGALNGFIAVANPKEPMSSLINKAKALPGLEGRDLTKEVTTDRPYSWPVHDTSVKSRKVVVLDFGVKQNILNSLAKRNCNVQVVPASTSTANILDKNPDGVLISNGPGDPAMVKGGIETIRELIRHNDEARQKGAKQVPLFGICLGHQLLGLALGGRTYKLKFGHHGANHPIKELETGRVDITTQNHGFCVTGERTKSGEWFIKGNKDAIVTHVNLNDNAIEGLRHKTLPIFSVQYHPEASAGPHDAEHLFGRFVHLMDESKK